MPTFPPGRSLIIPPSQLYSRSRPATALAAHARYPASNVTDGSSAVVFRSTAGTDAVTVTLATAKTPNIFGVIHHTIEMGRVCVFENNAGLARGAAARRPNFWLDLRGFPTTAANWTVGCNGNPKPIMFGEIVIGTGFEFDGVLRTAPTENVVFWQERSVTEYGRVALSAAKAGQRSVTLDVSLSGAEIAHFEQVAYEAGLTGERVVVVPDTRRNDIWFVRWPLLHELRYRRSTIAEVEASVELIEESAGVAP